MLDEAGSDGQTALHIAAQHGHEKAVGALIDAGAAVDNVNEITGRTPLHVSCVAGMTLTVALLLQAVRLEAHFMVLCWPYALDSRLAKCGRELM